MSTTYPFTPMLLRKGFNKIGGLLTRPVRKALEAIDAASRGTPSVKGETAPVSSGLLSLHTEARDAAKNLEKNRKFAQTEGTQGQVILG